MKENIEVDGNNPRWTPDGGVVVKGKEGMVAGVNVE